MEFRKFMFRLLHGMRLPTTSGKINVSALKQDVTIRRDKFGVVYIEAADDHDAWFSLGFCHGQDRAYQIENLVRIVRGTLAELLGPAGISVDRLSRRIGFYKSAQEQLEFLDNDVREMLEAYAQGINSGIELGCPRYAHEFSLLDTRPTTFTAADALGFLKFISFSLASNWDVELARLMILREDGPEAVEALDPSYPFWLRVTSPPTEIAGEAQMRLAEDLSLLMDTTGWRWGGSNCWAVSPIRTKSNRAILSNDPHLAPVIPPHWYLAQIRTPKWTVAGASFIGTPSFPTGHNGNVAWGITAGMLDNTDLFIEEMGLDGHSVREGNTFKPCESHIETISVRGDAPIQEEVLTTSRGPIVGPALDGEIGAISIKAIWLEPRPARGLFQIHRAQTFDEVRNCFEEWPLIPLNVIYADIDGVVGWQLTGEAPRRRKGWGTIPLMGSDTEVGWKDLPVDYEKMPFLRDPDAGYVASANNQPTDSSSGPFLGVDWTDCYRITRIAECLEERDNWDISSILSMQLDQISIPWREMREVVLATPITNTEAQQVLTILRDWDGQVSVDSIGASVFEFFLDEIIQLIARVKAPHSAEFALGDGFTPLAPNTMFIGRRIGHLVNLIRTQPEGWFEHPWHKEIEKSLAAAFTRLQAQFGSDTKNWTWGNIRKVTLLHPEGYRVFWGKLFNLGPISWGGDINTICQAEFTAGDPTSNPTSFASLRAVYDIGNWEESRFSLPGGQSGNPLSSHYSDQFKHWLKGEGIPIAWSKERIDNLSVSALSLMTGKT
jgi:penicillin amidase